MPRSRPAKSPSSPAPRRKSRPTATPSSLQARLEAEAMRQAECAAMLIAVTRMLLNMRGRDFATWLRTIAADFESTDPETEDPEDLAEDLIRLARDGPSTTADSDLADSDLADPADPAEPTLPPGRRSRHH